MANGKSFFDDRLQVRDSDKQKRRQARTNLNLEGTFTMPGDGVPGPCTLLDIGTGGLSFLTRSSLYLGDALSLRFKLSGHELVASGTVSRVSGKTVGVQFTGLGAAELELIQSFIHDTFFEKDPRKKN